MNLLWLCIPLGWFKMLSGRNTNRSGNIIKDDSRLQWRNETHFFIKIYLSFYFRKRPQFVVSWEIDEETYTQREDFFFPYLPGARGCQRLHHLASRDTSDWLRVTRLTPILSLCLNLTVWFSSRGVLPVTHLLYPTTQMCSHISAFSTQRDSLSKYKGQ